MYEYNLPICFETIAERFPHRTALWFNEHEKYTYAELNSRANRLARLLIGLSLSSGNVVCIAGIKNIHTFSLMIACLKLGVAYSIFDPDSPPERLHKIVSTCLPQFLIMDSKLIEKFSGLDVPAISTDEIEFSQMDQDDSNLAVSLNITGTSPSYIMFTSGSTGLPKGAVMTHAGVINLIKWGRETYSIMFDDILTNVNPLYFDNSVFDFYSALFNGACLVPFSKQETRNPKTLVEKVDAARCTLWFSVPSLMIFLQTMKATDGKYLRSIRRFIFGGEGYPKSKLKALYDVYSDTSEFFNVSGPTECTCICSSYKITSADFADLQGFPPIGSIAANFFYLILDSENKKVEDGELGELCLLGPNVGLGYYNDPDRSHSCFVYNPYNKAFREIMYRTGDLVSLNPADGKLYFHGRKDNQVKHMGYRIELEEIETALHSLNYVLEALAIHSVQNGLSRIISAVVINQDVTENQIRHDLRTLIPDYMIPSEFYFEQTLPKTSNGKVDRVSIKNKLMSLDKESMLK